jgi:hypothetical protein
MKKRQQKIKVNIQIKNLDLSILTERNQREYYDDEKKNVLCSTVFVFHPKDSTPSDKNIKFMEKIMIETG